MCGQVDWTEDAEKEWLTDLVEEDPVPTLDDVDPEDLGSGFHVVTLGPDGDDGWAE